MKLYNFIYIAADTIPQAWLHGFCPALCSCRVLGWWAPGLYSVWLYSTRCSPRLQEPSVCSQRVFDRVGVATWGKHQRGMSANSTTGVSSKHMDRHSISKLRCVYYAVFILIICTFVLLSIDNYEFFLFASVIWLRFAWQVNRLGMNEENLLIIMT